MIMRNKIFISHDHSLRSNEITMTKHRVIILYDSIFNSVFESQVLKPLIQNHKQENVHLISFEKNSIPHETLATLRNQGIVVHIYRRIPFLGLWSLRYARYCVQKI